jgi:hypothetical protein
MEKIETGYCGELKENWGNTCTCIFGRSYGIYETVFASFLRNP